MFISTIPMLLAPEGGIAIREKLEENSEKELDNDQKSIFVFIIFIIALVCMFLVRRGEAELTDAEKIAKQKVIQEL